MSFLKKSILTVCVLFLSISAVTAADSDPKHDDETKQQEKREKQFEKQMAGATLVGHFTVDGKQNNGKPPRVERYEIASAKKIDGNQWLLTARIKYGKHDISVPMPLNVFWAGDTPVISLTNLSIPGLGSGFTSRVMFFEGRYAGTWQHGQVGGHLWGKIEYAEKKSESKEEK